MFFPLGDQGGGMGGAQDINDLQGMPQLSGHLERLNDPKTMNRSSLYETRQICSFHSFFLHYY